MTVSESRHVRETAVGKRKVKKKRETKSEQMKFSYMPKELKSQIVVQQVWYLQQPHETFQLDHQFSPAFLQGRHAPLQLVFSVPEPNDKQNE